MNSLKFSQAAVDLIAKFEGFKSKPYHDSVGIATIGYGSTYHADGTKVTMEDAPIDQNKAKEMLLYHLNKVVLPDFQKHITVSLQQHQLDALACLVYNIGDGAFDKSSVLKAINDQITDSVVLESDWEAWSKAGGKTLEGLLNRRKAEYKYFTEGTV